MKPAYLFLAVLAWILYSCTLWASSQEGFTAGESVTMDTPYDDLYASIYDTLWNSSEEANQFIRVSIQDLALAEWPVANVKLVDLACGTAPYACWFESFDISYTGVDRSHAMIERAKRSCPSATFQVGDIQQATTFAPKSFSHACILGFSIYECGTVKLLADNVYMWLQPSGVLVVHMVDPDRYDPLLNLASPFAAFSLQKYALERQVDSELYFDQFRYKGTLRKQVGDDSATYSETLTFYNPTDGVKFREQAHNWTMPPMEDLIDTFRSAGFRHKESVHLVSCGKEYQYLVYFQR
jgi:trans-aconitate methyltransferase